MLSGCTEQTISYLTEALVRQGHEVTLFASGDSVTSRQTGRHMPTIPASVVGGISNYDAPLITLMERAFATPDTFDVIHSHLGFLPSSGTPVATHRFSPRPYSSRRAGTAACLPKNFPICHWCHSDAQRCCLVWANWHSTIHPGFWRSLLPSLRAGAVSGIPRSYHAGNRPRSRDRPCPNTPACHCVSVPRLTRSHAEYYQTVIEPLLDHPLVELVGELTDSKTRCARPCLALIAPYQQTEPFLSRTGRITRLAGPGHWPMPLAV